MRIGVDLGGTKIELIALGESGQTLLRRRVATPSGDYGGTLGAIVSLVESAEKELGATCTVGVGTPGALSRATGLIKNANSTCLIGKALREDLQTRLKRPVRIANDANCFALSEAVDGAAAGKSVVFGVIVGTGTGGGIVVNGQVLEGANAIAGEWGHNPLPWPLDDESPGPSCYCGKQGCIETFLSGPGFSQDYWRVTNEACSAEQLARLAVNGLSEAASAAFERYVHRMARALASVINVLDPDVIVLGGGMSNIMCLYHRVPVVWKDYVFSDVVDTQLIRAKHGDSSGVRGAAWLWSP